MANIKEVLENIGGAGRIGGYIILRPLIKARYQNWGATAEDKTRPLPGDERVSQPLVTNNLAITINAKAADVWPWIAQLGQERGGMYSYELLENLIGCKMHNAEQVKPEWEMKVGDLMRMGPPNYPVDQVVALERGHWLLMAGANPKTGVVDPILPGQTTYTNYTWLLYLDERPDGTTRLISRSHLDYAPRSFGFKLIWEVFTDPIGCVMTRKMLLTIKQRVEQSKR
ncbi:MAG: hypothetical protein U0559_02790 [Anaerolineae bacterium]